MGRRSRPRSLAGKASANPPWTNSPEPHPLQASGCPTKQRDPCDHAEPVLAQDVAAILERGLAPSRGGQDGPPELVSGVGAWGGRLGWALELRVGPKWSVAVSPRALGGFGGAPAAPRQGRGR